MTLPQLAIRTPRVTSVAQQKEAQFPKRLTVVVDLPRLTQELSPIERHVLARAASHRWTHQGEIAYKAPTLHQKSVALALAAPSMRLLAIVQNPRGDCAFRLTRLGEAVAQRVLKVVLAAEDHVREREFDRIRALMLSDLGKGDLGEEE